MNLHAALRHNAQNMFQRCEEAFDTLFGHVANPLRHLGALGLYLLWIIVGSGLYLYIVLDTSIHGAYHSISSLAQDAFPIGNILRSLHRYAADAFIVVMLLHMLREWAYSRYFRFRFYTWLTGVPILWLAYISGISGYWITWDQLAQLSAIASTELLDWLPIFSEPAARNFLTPDSINDRFFTMLVFLHLAVPLFMILGLWAHVHRISRVDYLPSRSLMLGTLSTLLLLAAFKPALSDTAANLALTPAPLRFDWFILFIHPLTDLSSAPFMLLTLGAATVLLFALPFLSPPVTATNAATSAMPVAIVDAAHCSGCDRCLADCPYAAISMSAHPLLAKRQLAVVDSALCASCGLCAGACPSSTPFRRPEQLVTGIDMPQLSIHKLRQQLEAALDVWRNRTNGAEHSTANEPRIVVFACQCGANSPALAAENTAVIPLLCAGQLPPSFIEYALRGGATGVLINSCREGACEFRLGEQLLRERIEGTREPALRRHVPKDRLQLCFASPQDQGALNSALKKFTMHLKVHAQNSTSPPTLSPYLRSSPRHV